MTPAFDVPVRYVAHQEDMKIAGTRAQDVNASIAL
jgi:hypothetical protein